MSKRAQIQSISFAVDDVQPVTDRLPTWKTRDGIRHLRSLVNICKPVKPVLSCSGYNSDCIEKVFFNPLVNGIHLAFEQHRPVVLSPDMLWITILQGLSQHIRNNSEHFRHKLVAHQGKLTLKVSLPDFIEGSPENDWEGILAQFSAAIKDNVSANYDRLIADFSTTGPLERAVCDVTLMDMFSPFFEYLALSGCGIPTITLEGEQADWTRLKQKVEYLSEFELDWWLEDLRIITEQFARAARGQVDRGFWQGMYKVRNGYGDVRINGWIARLFPYIKCWNTETFTVVNPLLGTPYDLPPGSENDDSIPEVSSNRLPSGLATAVVTTLDLRTSARKEVNFIGGFVGVEQVDGTMAIRPKLGWAVAEGETDPMFENIPEDCRLLPAAPTAVYARHINRLAPELWRNRIPDDFLKFYMECDGISLEDESNPAKFRSIENIEVVKVPTILPGKKVPGYDPERDVFLQKRKEHGTWLRFCDLPDGKYFALEREGFYINQLSLLAEADDAGIQVLEGDPIKWRICLIDPNSGEAKIVATKFSDFVHIFCKTRGTLNVT